MAVLRATYADAGWEAPRILAALDDAPLYVDQIAQVRLPTWHRGRVAVLGDAAWCAGPFGTGTTSALAGAYVLAGELGATPDDVPAAFARYERLLRPLDRPRPDVRPPQTATRASSGTGRCCGPGFASPAAPSAAPSPGSASAANPRYRST